MAKYAYNNNEQNSFWLKIMIIKAKIIFSSLPPDSPEVESTNEFTQRFEDLFTQGQNLSGEMLAQFNQKAYDTAIEFRTLVLEILKKQLINSYYLNLKPSFVNSVVTIIDHYIYLLGVYLQGREPEIDPVIHDIFWLPIFLVDSRLIIDNVEFFNNDIRRKAENFENSFRMFYEYAVTIQGFLRTELSDFPIALEYRNNIKNLMTEFAVFVVDLLNLLRNKKLPGELTLLELECTYRIVCYYTTQLSIFIEVPKPACDPGAPTIF